MSSLLAEDVFDDASMNVGESIVSAGVSEGEALVIEPEQMEEGGVEVMNVDAIAADLDAIRHKWHQRGA